MIINKINGTEVTPMSKLAATGDIERDEVKEYARKNMNEG